MGRVGSMAISGVATRRRQFLCGGVPWTEVHGYHHGTAIAVQEGPDRVPNVRNVGSP
jgi:hypothetical protein